MGVISVTGLSVKDPRTTNFVVEAYSDAGYTTIVDAGTAPAVWDRANGISKMIGVIRLRNLVSGTTYYLRSASIIQDFGVSDWLTYASAAGADSSAGSVSFGSGPPSGSADENAVYFDTSDPTAYVMYVYHSGAWHNVTGTGSGGGGTSGGGIFSSGSNSHGSWVQDPTGHIHQWGVISAPASLTFPTPFSSATGVVVSVSEVYPGSGSSHYPNVTGAATATGCSIGVSDGASSSVYWEADGPGVATPGTVLVDPTTTEGDMIYRHSGALDRLPVGTNGQVIMSNGTDPGFADMPHGSYKYQLGSYLPGSPGTSQVVGAWGFLYAWTLPANCTGSVGSCDANPTATATYNIKKNGSTVGTVSISTSGVFTFATTGGTAVSFAAGDLMTLVAPGSADATLAGVKTIFSANR